MKSLKHLRFVASLHCMLTPSTQVQAHHLLRVEEKGMGRKNGDEWVVPLDYRKHRELHDMCEIKFFAMHGWKYEKVKDFAIELCKCSPCDKIRGLYEIIELGK